MRIAYASPLPPETSGVADYSALLLPALGERIDVRVVRRRARKLPAGVDIGLFHVGNDADAHGWILELLQRNPGVVVLHDFVLHHLVAGMTLGRGHADAYVRALEREAGLPGRLLAHGVVDGSVPPPWEAVPDRFPLVHVALDAATGVVVHSRYVERRVREQGYGGPVWRIPHPAWPAPEGAAETFPDRYPVIACFGHLNPSKRIPQLLAAFARVRETHERALLVLAGSIKAGGAMESRLRRTGLELGRDVIAAGRVPEERLWALMRGCDVCVSLRWPTMGETSGAVLRTLSAGVPLVVSDIGWFAELPGDVAAKVPVDEHEVETLAAFLRRIADDDELRTGMGAAALRYAREEHDLGRVADLYAAALEEAAGGPQVTEAVLRELAGAAADVQLEADADELGEIAGRFRETRLGR